MRSSLVVLLVATSAVLSTAALAQSTPAGAARSSRAASDTARIGSYDLELTTDNGTTTGTLSVKKGERGLAAVLTVGGHSPDVKSFVRTGPGYTIEAGTPTFTVTYTLTFANDSLSGAFTMSTGLSGTVIGARKP